MKKRNHTVIGFKDEAVLVRSVARLFKTRPIFAVESRYAAGEMAVFDPVTSSHVVIVANVVESSSSLFRVLLLAEASRARGATRVDLIAPWIAYGRQDRSTKSGEAPAGIVLANLLSHAFDHITTLDAHSPAFRQAFRGRLRNVLPPIKKTQTVDLVAAPDRGATDRAHRVARMLDVPSVVITKQRTADGVRSKLDAPERLVAHARVLLVDDIADSGGTLDAASCVLKSAGAKSVSAFVTHAVDLKRLSKKLQPNISSVSTVFDHSRDRLDPTALRLLVAALR